VHWHHFPIRLAPALLLGALIGAERQWRQRMAGLRTNALVAAGAAMFVGQYQIDVTADAFESYLKTGLVIGKLPSN
jgi:uncharacterized membrane protein YhiD involved in acid resistance